MRHMKTFFSLLLLFFATTAVAQNVAITMDNPNTEPSPIWSAAVRDQYILQALHKHQLKIVLFVQGAQVDDAEGALLLQRWNRAGHTLGNHTYSHASLNTVSEKEYEQDTLRNERLLTPYAHFKKIFRFPYLKEGDTVAKRDGFRQFLKDHRYLSGAVTIDASDWYINDRLEKRLAKDPHADIGPYRDYYLKHMWERAEYYDALAKDVLGRHPNHTLLIHHNLLNALFLDDLIQLFKRKGWNVISPEEAYHDTLFQLEPAILPAGESIIWALAKETGRYENRLRYPAEDGEYEREAMDKLGL